MAPADHLTDRERERLTRAPQWMRDLALRLTASLDVSREENTQLQADIAEAMAIGSGGLAVTTIADPHADIPRPVGDNPLVQHTLANGRVITVDFQYDYVEVSADSGALAIHPVVSNCVKVAQRDQ